MINRIEYQGFDVTTVTPAQFHGDDGQVRKVISQLSSTLLTLFRAVVANPILASAEAKYYIEDLGVLQPYWERKHEREIIL